MGAIPCLILGGRREVPALLRGLLLAAAALLISLTVLGQSRGSLFVLPLMILLAVLLVPGRGRTIVSMAGVAIAVGAIWTPLADVYTELNPLGPPGPALDDAVRAILIASGLLGLVGLLVALADRRIRVTPTVATRVSAGFALAFAAVCLAGVIAYAAVEEDPVSTVSDKWNEFKKGGTTPSFDESRLSLSVTTYRYDYWRVAWDEFRDHPFKGVGVDNFQRDYLREGRSKQTPTYPHSTELRPLSQTGVVGGLLFFGALAAAVTAAAPSIRRGGLAGAVGGSGLLVFAYFLLHGAVDWLWEFPALGGPAFAFLAMAGVTAVDRNRATAATLPGRRALAVAGACLGVVLLVAMTLPWLAERDLRKARQIAGSDPVGALDRLDRSANLDRLSPVAEETAGVIERRARALSAPPRKHFRGRPRPRLEQPVPLPAAGRDRRRSGGAAEALRLIERAQGARSPGSAHPGSRCARCGRGGTSAPSA